MWSAGGRLHWLAVLLSTTCGLGWADTGNDILDCNSDPEWSSFRLRLVQNSNRGFPVDGELVLEAQQLLQKHKDALVPDQNAAYGASEAMQSFFTRCNAPPSTPEQSLPPRFCLYGIVAALWLMARSGHPDRLGLLGHAEFLLGSTMRHSLDFMESSGWPVTSLDVFANVQRPAEDFRLPSSLQLYVTPQADPLLTIRPVENSQSNHIFDKPVRINVWEIGVHASLSAEPLQMWARYFPRVELLHRNLIQDQYPPWLPDKCTTLYGNTRLTCDTQIDDITTLFRTRIPHSSTSKDPVESIDLFRAEFISVVGSRLDGVDAFLCTVAYLCLLLRDINLPVIGYFGHPLLFMAPRDSNSRDRFWAQFTEMSARKHVAFAVSDPFLQMQFEYQIGTPRLPAIRTHALYTGATHYPARANDILVLDRPHESVVMCVIQSLMPGVGEAGRDQEWPVGDGRLRAASSPGYPYRFLTRALTDKQFSTFAQFRAVILWAYDMDLITFYEFYSMNMPIFMPSHLSKYVFQQDHMHYNGRWTSRKSDANVAPMWPPTASVSPFNETSLDAVRLIVGFSDYFRFPEVQYFASIPHLLEKLLSANFFEIVQAMFRFNQESLVESANSWSSLLKRATGWDPEVLQR